MINRFLEIFVFYKLGHQNHSENEEYTTKIGLEIFKGLIQPKHMPNKRYYPMDQKKEAHKSTCTYK